MLVAENAAELAAEFTRNFEELWTTRDVEASGREDPRPLDVDGRGGARLVHASATARSSHRIAKSIGKGASACGSPRR